LNIIKIYPLQVHWRFYDPRAFGYFGAAFPARFYYSVAVSGKGCVLLGFSFRHQGNRFPTPFMDASSYPTRDFSCHSIFFSVMWFLPKHEIEQRSEIPHGTTTGEEELVLSIRNVLLFMLLITLSLFALACQKHDQPVAPQVTTQVQPILPSPTAPFTAGPPLFLLKRMGQKFSNWDPGHPGGVPPAGVPINIISPVSGSVYESGQPIPFEATINWPLSWWAWYRWDPNGPGTSDGSGMFGEGETNFTKSDLPPGGGYIYMVGFMPGLETPAYPYGYWPPYGYGSWIVVGFPNIVMTITQAPTASLKIAAPPNNSAFDYGRPITFLGTKTGNVTNIQWSTNNVVFGTGLTATNSDLLPGSHTITLTGQVGNSQFSNSITVGIRPITLEVTIDPTTVRPSQTPLRTSPTQPTRVTVHLRSGNTPVAGRQVQLVAAGVPGSGGHSEAEHNNGTRPIPDGIYGVFAAGQGVTNAAGEFTTNYTPTRFGGSETITITSPDFPNASAIATLTVTVQNLDVLPRDNARYIQTGGQNNGGPRAGHFVHPGPVNAGSQADPNENHWGTQGLRDGIGILADAYNDEYPNDPLYINDMSLRNGGLFDIDGDWDTDHWDHRTGLNVDIEMQGRLLPAERRYLEDLVATYYYATWNVARTRTHGGNHLHLESFN